ncbi:hypothetical protein FRC07_009029 [Ceratobasidium sp. 392]|nr:hypothetical protein FRC07_009029 [Ceratobasidium sp. 392]
MSKEESGPHTIQLSSSGKEMLFVHPGFHQGIAVQTADSASSTTEKPGLVYLTQSAGETYTIKLGDKYLSPSKTVSNNKESDYHVKQDQEADSWTLQPAGGSLYRITIPDQNVCWFAEATDKAPVQLSRAIGRDGEFWIIKKEDRPQAA